MHYNRAYDRSHQDNAPFECRFYICNKDFPEYDARTTHESTHAETYEQKKGPYFCLVEGCPRRTRRFDNLNSFKAHWKKTHPKKVQCNVRSCGDWFKNSEDLDEHRQTKHLTLALTGESVGESPANEAPLPNTTRSTQGEGSLSQLVRGTEQLDLGGGTIAALAGPSYSTQIASGEQVLPLERRAQSPQRRAIQDPMSDPSPARVPGRPGTGPRPKVQGPKTQDTSGFGSHRGKSRAAKASTQRSKATSRPPPDMRSLMNPATPSPPRASTPIAQGSGRGREATYNVLRERSPGPGSGRAESSTRAVPSSSMAVPHPTTWHGHTERLPSGIPPATRQASGSGAIPGPASSYPNVGPGQTQRVPSWPTTEQPGGSGLTGRTHRRSLEDDYDEREQSRPSKSPRREPQGTKRGGGKDKRSGGGYH